MSKQNFTILFLGILFMICLSFLIFGYSPVLRTIWHIPVMYPYFADIRMITGVNETVSQGLDPLVANIGDPWGRPMNYPRIWQYLAQFLEFDQHVGNYFGLVNVSLFIIGFWLFVSRIKLSIFMVLILLVIFFSPASILAMERGNIDIVMFFLLSIALVYIYQPIVFSLIVLTASALKIFPIFAIVGLLKQARSQFIIFFLTTIVVFTCYMFLTLDDIVLIMKGTPQEIDLSYGRKIIAMSFSKIAGNPLGQLLKIITYLYPIGIFIYVFLFLKRYQAICLEISKIHIDAFRIGSSIFIASFLLINNWDYRLIFLIFTLPQLVIWIASEANKLIRIVSIISVGSIIWTTWFLEINRLLNGKIAWMADELSNWVLFSTLFFLFMITLPAWILELIKIDKFYENTSI